MNQDFLNPTSVKLLRKLSGAGLMDCKNALGKANGDIYLAAGFIRIKGLAVHIKGNRQEWDRKKAEEIAREIKSSHPLGKLKSIYSYTKDSVKMVYDPAVVKNSNNQKGMHYGNV